MYAGAQRIEEPAMNHAVPAIDPAALAQTLSLPQRRAMRLIEPDQWVKSLKWRLTDLGVRVRDAIED